MRSAKLAAAFALAALTLSACGSTTKPQAGAGNVSSHKSGARGVVDDPRLKYLKCLEATHLPVTERGTTDLLVGAAPNQVAATFTPTPGAAQDQQISGHTPGAEVIGSVLVYPGTAPDSELQPIEDCLSQGVKG
ncbi:MAG: hypothetical protein ACR2JH_02145 [Solirubrobacteraceae bacterium]